MVIRLLSHHGFHLVSVILRILLQFVFGQVFVNGVTWMVSVNYVVRLAFRKTMYKTIIVSLAFR